MIWTLDMDDFRGEFCCQGKFPLIRTIKAVLHGQLKLLPKERICSTCPTKEYKGIFVKLIFISIYRYIYIDFKSNPPQTTEKPKKRKRDAEGPCKIFYPNKNLI